MTTYSHSSLALFENCPRAYKFDKIEKPDVEESKNVDAFMGSRVHEVLEHLYQDLKYEKRNSLDDLLAYYAEVWRKNWSKNTKVRKEGLTAGHYKQFGKRCIRDYYRHYEPFDEGRTIATEYNVSIEIEGYKLNGKIDRLTAFPDGFYEIHDYKASQYLPPQRKLDTDRQLALYQIGIQQQWKDVKRVDLVWHYLAFDKERKSKRTEKEIGELKRSVISLIKQIERAVELDEFPTKKGLCDYCGYQELCPEWKHPRKIESLPANKFLKEPGVKLVNEFAKLKSRMGELEEQEKNIKEAIIAFAKREGLSCIQGRHNKVLVKIGSHIKFPTSGEEEREELEKLIKSAGRWEEVSSLKTQALEKIAREESWPPQLLKKLKQYQSIEESIRVSLVGLKEED